MRMKTKAEVAQWLDDRGWTFTEMTDAQKWEMRQTLNICGAATSTSKYKAPCPKLPMANGRCKTHRGDAKRGIAHPNYKHGKYSRYSPMKWIEAMERAAEDPQLADLNRDLITVEAAIDETLRRIDLGASTDVKTTKLIGSARALMQAVKKGDGVTVQRLIPAIESLTDEEQIDADLRSELKEWIDLRRQLIGEESKVRQRLQTSVSLEEASRQFQALALAVKSNIRKMSERRELSKDQADVLLDNISEDFIRIVGFTALPRPEASLSED